MNGNPLVDTLLSRHGGREAWRTVQCIEAELSTGGLAFASRGQFSPLRGCRIQVDPHHWRVTLSGYPDPDCRAEWTPGRVTLDLGDGTPPQTRLNPRDRFKGWLRHPRWDALDLLYFVGYAIWNYLSFPWLLTRDDVQVRVAQGRPDATGPLRLEARFAPGFPTHSPVQHFHLGADGLLVRHDYVAEVMGPWASAAHFCLDHQWVDGLRLYTRRRVVPALGHWGSLPGPTLVWIELGSMQVKRDAPTR